MIVLTVCACLYERFCKCQTETSCSAGDDEDSAV
jgi:hypothetical protein